MNLHDENLKLLLEEIEKVRRRKVINYDSKDNIQYLDPLNNLGKIKIPNNHLILGRRGSGKTTLLLSTIKQDSKNFISPIDCQIFREWQSHKIILHLLANIAEKLRNQVQQNSDFKNLENEKSNISLLKKIKNLFFGDKVITKLDEFYYLIATLKKTEYLINVISDLPLDPIIIDISSSLTKNETKKINTDRKSVV